MGGRIHKHLGCHLRFIIKERVHLHSLTDEGEELHGPLLCYVYHIKPTELLQVTSRPYIWPLPTAWQSSVWSDFYGTLIPGFVF